MTKYYHLTQEGNVAAILNSGLIPKVPPSFQHYIDNRPELRCKAQESEFLNKILFQPYLYIYSSPRSQVSPKTIQLEIDVPEQFAVERDYHQHMLVYLTRVSLHLQGKPDFIHKQGLEQQLAKSERELDVTAFMSRLEEELDVVDFEAGIRAIVNATDAIPYREWDSQVGAYRTAHAISGNIKVLEKGNHEVTKKAKLLFHLNFLRIFKNWVG